MYDYIIIGAGSSGATLAARLTEDPTIRVLLLEAGPDYRSAEAPEAMRVPNPGPMLSLEHFPEFQWPELQARRTAAQEPRLYWRGRGLGGSSAINGQIAIRAPLEDFDLWAAQGCTGWGGEEVMPYFIRLEDDLAFGDRPYHGQGGPIPIYRAPLTEWGAVDQALREAALDLGYPWAEDHNAPGSTGVSTYAINSRNQRRVTTNDGYLEPARDRPNLTIQGNAHVDRVLFEEKRAVGVRVRIEGEWQEIRAKEIILSAGAVHSPAILMRSGVGAPAALAELGIEAVADLPVGKNFQDHAIAGLVLQLKPQARAKSPFARHTNCCVRYTSGLAEAGPNDMMIVCLNLFGDSIGRHLSATGELIQSDVDYEAPSGLIGVWVNRVFSRGTLSLVSPDPEIDPAIEENMLSDERDLIRMRDGVERLFTIGRHPAVQAIAEAVYIDADQRTMADLDTPEKVDEWLLAHAGDTQHAAGTCRMGDPADSRTVVDPECRVVGLENLRVIDASIMPDVPRANTHLTCVMIGEYMAERIKQSRR